MPTQYKLQGNPHLFLWLLTLVEAQFPFQVRQIAKGEIFGIVLTLRTVDKCVTRVGISWSVHSAEAVPVTHVARVPHEERRELSGFYGWIPGLSSSGEPKSPVSWSMLSPSSVALSSGTSKFKGEFVLLGCLCTPSFLLASTNSEPM